MDPSANTFTLLTWNVNGLDDEDLVRERRTNLILREIIRVNPDILFLQEVVHETYVQFAYQLVGLGHYICASEPPKDSFYFTCVFVKSNIVVIDSIRVPFCATYMGRDIARITLQLGHIQIHLYNCHLESMKESSDIRIAQMKQVMEMARDESGPVILAGDWNARDAEVKKASLSVRGISLCDSYVHFGKPKSDSKTWLLPGSSFIGCRFDRVYHNCHPSIQFVQQRLAGKTTLSDHFGLWVEMRLSSSS
jgi:endonuclease/exonuclease/phosphatase family metal-dependent hydrolase